MVGQLEPLAAACEEQVLALPIPVALAERVLVARGRARSVSQPVACSALVVGQVVARVPGLAVLRPERHAVQELYCPGSLGSVVVSGRLVAVVLVVLAVQAVRRAVMAARLCCDDQSVLVAVARQPPDLPQVLQERFELSAAQLLRQVHYSPQVPQVSLLRARPNQPACQDLPRGHAP